MGQRSQIILILPEVYYNENNPNNREYKRVVVLHNQWLYGCSFLKYIEKLLIAIKHTVKTEKQHGYTLAFDLREIDAIIGYANYSELGYTTHSHYYFGSREGEKEKEDLKRSKNAFEFIKAFDNNNGYIFINVSKDGEVAFDIMTGVE